MSLNNNSNISQTPGFLVSQYCYDILHSLMCNIHSIFTSITASLLLILSHGNHTPATTDIVRRGPYNSYYWYCNIGLYNNYYWYCTHALLSPLLSTQCVVLTSHWCTQGMPLIELPALYTVPGGHSKRTDLSFTPPTDLHSQYTWHSELSGSSMNPKPWSS